MKEDTKARLSSSLQLIITTAGLYIPILLSSFYVFALGYIEFIGLPVYPSLGQSALFFTNSVIYKLELQLKSISVSAPLLIPFFMIAAALVLRRFYKPSLPPDRLKYYSEGKIKLHSSSASLEEKIKEINSLNDMQEKELRRYRGHMQFILSMIIALSPITFFSFYVLHIEMLVLMPIILTTIIGNIALSMIREWNIRVVHFLFGIVIMTFVGVGWLLPYKVGHFLAHVNFDQVDVKFPAYYFGSDAKFGHLLWIEGDRRYFVSCEKENPKIYENNGGENVFIRNADSYFRSSFCQ